MEEKEDKINDALDYASATSKIEDMNLDQEELQEVREALTSLKSDKSFLQQIIDNINKSKGKKHGKAK